MSRRLALYPSPRDPSQGSSSPGSSAVGSSPSRLIDRVSVAAPCPAKWEDMVGDDRTRFCGHCAKNVYNVSAMTAAEAEALIREKEGRVCMRLFRRADGTVLTSDCPLGLAERAYRQARRAVLASLALFVTLSATFLSIFSVFGGGVRRGPGAFVEPDILGEMAVSELPEAPAAPETVAQPSASGPYRIVIGDIGARE